jgi:flagellar hook-associated protein 1
MSVNSINASLAGLQVTKARIDTLSRNISNAQTPGYSKKISNQTTGPLGGVELSPIRRNVDQALARSLCEATGSQNQLQTTVNLLTQLETAFGTPEANTSLSSQITNLQNAFQNVSVSPEKASLYNAVIDAANGVARTLNQLSQTATSVGQEAVTQLAQDLTTVNQTLISLNDVNNQIVANSGTDVTDFEDQRDQLLLTLSGLVDITTFNKPSGAIAVYTRDGKPLVDGSVATLSLGGTTGVTWSLPNSAPVPLKVGSGTIGGVLGLLNTTLPAVQDQLDDIARALTVEFNAIDVPIFCDPGNIPFVATPALVDGYASRIAVNPTVTQQVIHDGAPQAWILVPGPALLPGDTTNIDNAIALLDRTNVAFSAAGLPTSGNIAQVATDFIASQSLQRANAEDALGAQKTLQQTLQSKMSADSGVNVDDEVAQLAVLQNAYSANARVLQTTNDLFMALFNSV